MGTWLAIALLGVTVTALVVSSTVTMSQTSNLADDVLRGAADVAADDAATFVAEVGVALGEFEEETGVAVAHHAGLCAGDVVSGLLHRETFTDGLFGEPTRVALALDAVAADGQILVHESVAARLGPQWLLERADGLVDLRGDAVEALLLVGSRTPDPQATASV